MSEQSIQKIIDETTFSMEAEGFILPDDEILTIRKVLAGDIPFTKQLEWYVEKARCAGGIVNAPKQ